MAQARNNAPRPGAPTPASEAGRPLRWSPGPDFFALGAPVAALALLIVGAVLHVPGGWGIEDFLGWTEGRRGGAAPLLLHLWAQSGRTVAAWLYLALDSLAFVPLYSGALLALGVRLAQALGADRFALRARREDMALHVLVPPVLALALVDLVENGIGLSRIGSAGPWLALASTGLGAALVQWGGTLRHLMPRLGGGVSATTALLALGTLGAATAGVPACLPPGAEWISALGCGAHAGKGWLAALVGALFAATALGWLAGVALPADAPAELRAQRLRLRSAVRDTLLRSRYVLLALTALAVLLLGPDAGRDALYAIAASPFRAAQADLGERLMRAFGTLGAFAVTAAALWTLLFACWLWTRSACQLRRAHSPVPEPGAAPVPGQALAQDWAGIVSFVPAALLTLLTAQVVRETALAQAIDATAPWLGPVLLLAGFGLAVLALGAAFVAWQRHADADSAPGYDALSWAQWAAHTGVLRSRGNAAPRPAAAWRFAALVPPQGLLPLLLVLLLLVRAIDLLPASGFSWQLDRLPTLGLAAALLSVALWLTVFGWLSLLEVATARPWVLLLVPALALLAALGWTASDAVWPAVAHADGAAPAGGLRMLAFTALLGGVLLLAQALVLAHARRRIAVAQGLAPRTAPTWSALLPTALALLLGAVLWAADDVASPRPPARAKAVLSADARPTLDFALTDWLLGLCHSDPNGRAEGAACRPTLALDAQGGLRVTLVAAEGGGMGGAAWTAFALQQLAQRDPALPRRTFAVTGVSGAALGAALLRGCTAEGRIDEDCLERLARADLVSPLLSAGLFEDVLATLLPTRWCTLPGCGFLTRTAWFEQALESGAPALRQGLMASRQRQLDMAGAAHVPWLLLQARWADSGERAIASDLRIDWRQFPGARDQLGLTGRDLPLGTAAHNAARAPLLHPAGALQAPRARCLERGGEVRTPAQRLDASPLQTCGHLDDGALADPGATQTTLDLLHALGRCLAAAPSAADRALFPRCAALDGAQRAWLREHLVPQVLVLRPAPAPQPGEDWCPALDQRPPTAAELALQQPQAGCAAPERAPRLPERPTCPARGEAAWFESLLPAGAPSPAQSATAALAEARLAQGAAALRASLGGAAQASAEPGVRAVELLPDGTRWARGWHLSALGVERMWRQARGCVGQGQGVTP